MLRYHLMSFRFSVHVALVMHLTMGSLLLAAEDSNHADFYFDSADHVVQAELWENPLDYDADVLVIGNRQWYAWLEFVPGSGDTIWVGCRAANQWVEKRKLEVDAGEYAAPTLTEDQAGQIWLTYEARVADQWDLFALAVSEGATAGQVRKISESSGSDILHRTSPAKKGVWAVWQSDQEGQFDILLRHFGSDGSAPIRRVSDNPLGDAQPAVAVDAAGRVYIGWDAWDGESYNVMLRTLSDGAWNDPIAIAASPRFEGRVDVAVDQGGYLWMVWEEGGEEWGEAFRGINTVAVRDAAGPLHRRRELRFAIVDAAGELRHTPVPLPMPSVGRARQRADRPPGVEQLGAFYERARLTTDRSGKLWVVYRHYYAPWLGISHRTHVEDGWGVYARYYGEDGWSPLYRFRIGQGDGMQRLETTALEDGILAAWTTGRTGRTSDSRPRGVVTATIQNDASPPATLPPRTAAAPLVTAQPVRQTRRQPAVAAVAGQDFRLFFGDLHRHTDFSLCRVPLDGTLDDAYRYATDVAQLDFLGITDHSRDIAEGSVLSQLWHRSRKEVYRRQLIDRRGMVFMPFYAYERSHGNTADHNVISLRGDMLRPHTYPVPVFWRELDADTLTIPHQPIRRDTWNYQSDAHRPLVEIFQGCRDESIEQDVHDGLAHGYHLGFIASSDHMSTSASYAGVWAEAADRETVFRALQARRTFAATAKIEVKVLADEEFWMGEIVPVGAEPVQLSLTAHGAGSIRTVHLIVDGNIEKTYTPGSRSVSLAESIDPAGRKYAYFHLIQGDGNEAWSSPIWFQQALASDPGADPIPE